MKKFLLLICILPFVSCGGSGGSSSSFDLFTTAEKTTPIVKPSSTASIASANWTMGQTLYEIFQLIREYNNDRDNGHIDGSNMHKALYEANTYVAAAITGCIDSTTHTITDQAITPPFDFGSDLLAQTYNCAYTVNDTGTPSSGQATNYTKSFAVKYSGGIYYMLMGWYASEGTQQTTPSVTQLQYDTNTNDIKLNNAYLVNYSVGGSYNVLIYIRGNTASHLFSLKLLKYSASSPSISGYGYSEGTGKYYLFKVIDTGGTKYFCIPSDATEDSLKAMADAGEATPPALCADLETGLPTNYKIDGSESATTTDKFTGAGTSKIELT